MKKKILVVDDEADLRKVLLLRLNKTGYEAFGVADGLEGFDLACRRMPDLIVLNRAMPKMSGREFARRVKRDERLKHIPIILISAEAENLELNERKVGVVGYFKKPFEMKALIGMIENQISSDV